MKNLGVPTVEPVDGRLGRGRVVEGHGGLALELAGLAVSVEIDHGLAGLLVGLGGESDQ